MKGDILYVERKPLLWHSTKNRKSAQAGKIDGLMMRTMKYRHYGVEVEDGQVVHFLCDTIMKLEEGRIVKTSIQDFLKDGQLSVEKGITYEFTRDEIVERAESLIGTDFNGYSVRNNNCEHFAFWCVTGNKESQQVFLYQYGKSIMRAPLRLNPFTQPRRMRYVAIGSNVYKSIFRRN